jgi:hypothetical protein
MEEGDVAIAFLAALATIPVNNNNNWIVLLIVSSHHYHIVMYGEFLNKDKPNRVSF